MAKQLNVNLAFTANTNEVRGQLQELQRQLTQIMQTASQKSGSLGMTKELQEATQAAASLKAHLEQATNVNTGKLDLGLLNKSFKDAGTSLDQYREKLQKLGPSGEQAFNTLASSILKAEVPLKQTNGLLNEFATTLKNTARWQLSSSILHGFMGSLQTAFYYAQDLNESLNNIRIVTGNSVDEMAKFAVEANKAAQALSTTTTEYTNAALIYYQQGLSDEEVRERTDVTVKMANVARESAEIVSQQMTAVWNNFDDGSKSLEYYADVMTALGAATASSTDEIAEGLEKFASVADTVGLSYEYATAALATVTATTRQSADVVGNAFKTLFARLEGLNLGETLDDGTDLNKYSSALLAVGINIKDVNGDMKSMDQILDELGSKWNTLAKDQQMALAQTIAGVRQYTQLIALMDNWDFFQSNLDVANGAEGALQEQADIYAESWEAARDRVKAAAEEIYSELLNDKFFIDLNNGFAGFLNLLSNTIKGIGGVQGALAMLGNVVSRVFAQDIAGSIDRFITNLQDSKKIADDMRNAALESVAKMSENTDLGTVYEHLAQPQEAYIRNAEKMSEIERRTAEYLLSQHEARVQELAVLEQAKNDAEAIAQAEMGRLKNQLLLNNATKGQTQYVDNTVKGYENVLKVANQLHAVLPKAFSSASKGTNQGLKEVSEIFQSINTNGAKFSSEIQNAFNVLKSGNADAQTTAQALETLETALNSMGEASGLDATALENLRTALSAIFSSEEEVNAAMQRLLPGLDDLAGKTYNAAQREKELSQETQSLSDAFDATQNKMLTTGQQIVSLAQGLSTVAMGINMLKGLGSIWTNDDLSAGEKFLSTLTTLGMVIPMLITSSQGLAASQITVNANSLVATFLNSSLATSLFGVKAAEDAATAGAITLEAAFPPLLIVALALAAALAAFIGIGLGVKAAFEAIHAASPEGKLEAAEEEAKALSETFAELKSEADGLASAFDAYDSVVDRLTECTRGTDEWAEALQAVNDQVLDMLDTYPELLQYVQRGENGQLFFNQSDIDNVLKGAQQRASAAQYASLEGEVKVQQAQINVDKSELAGDFALDAVGGYIDEYNQTEYSKAYSILSNSFEELAGLTQDEYKEKLQELGLTESTSEALVKYQDDINTLAANTQVAATALENIGTIVASQNLDSDKYSDAAMDMAGNAYQDIYDDIYGKIIDLTTDGVSKVSSNKNSQVQEVWKRYNEALGSDYALARNGVRGTDGNRTFAYLDDGETKEVTKEQMAATIAAYEALEQLGVAADDAAQTLSDMHQNVEEQTAAGIENWITSGNFNSMARGDFDTLKESIGKAGSTEEYLKAIFGVDSDEELLALAQQLGKDTTEELVEAFEQSIADYDAAIEDMKNNMLQSSKEVFESLNVSDLSVNAQKAVANVLEQALIYGGTEGLNAVNEVLSNLKSEQLEDFIDVTSEIDWDVETVEDLKQVLEAAGISTDNFNDKLQDFIDAMSSTSIATFDALAEKYAEIHEIIDGLEMGDTISAEDYQALGEAGNGYFTRMMDGTYKLTGDAEEFYKLVQGQEIAKYQANISKLQDRNDTLQSISGYDFQGLSQNANYQNEAGENRYDRTTVQQQIDIIRELGDQSEVTKRQIAEWQEQIDNGSFTNVESLQEIADAVVGCSESWNNLDGIIAANQSDMLQMDIAIASSYDNFRDLRQALEDDTISLEAFNTAAVNLDKLKDIEDLDPDELKEFANYLQDISDSADDLADDMSDAASKIVAKGIMKMNDGIDTLANNWENWSSILTDSMSSAEEYAEAMNGMRDAMADVLDISEEFIDADFIKNNLEDIKLAAEGDAEAIDRLREALVEPIVAKIEVDNDLAEGELLAQVNNLQSMLDEMGNLVVGTEVDDSSFIDACNEMIAATGMTTEQVNALFDAMGFEANFAAEGQPVTNKVQEYITHHEIIRNGSEKINGQTVETFDEKTWTEPGELKEIDGEATAFAFSTNGEVPKINSVIKKASGSANNYSSSNAGGTKSPGGKSKSGGGSKGKSKDTKDHKEFDDEIDRYWDINNAIKETSNEFEELSDEMKKTQTVADHLFGKALIDNLKQQNAQIERENALISKQRANYEELYRIQSQELVELESKLSAFGGQFAGDALTNYTALLQQGLAAYNAAIDAYNASAQEDADKQALEAAEKRYNELKTLLDRYQTLYYNDMADTQDKLRDLEQQELENRLKILENNLKAWEIEIELKLDVTKAKRDWNEFLNEVKQDFRKVYSDLTIDSKFDKDNFDTYVEDVGTTIGAIKDVENEINKMKNGGSSDMFYDISEAQEKLKELQEQLIEQGKSLNDLYKQVWDNYIDGLDQTKDKLDDIMDQYERIDDELEYEKELIELLYGDKAYDLMDKYYKAQQKNTLAQIDSLRTQVDFWQSEFDKAYQMNKDKHNVDLNDMSTWTEDMRKAYENMQDAQADLNDLILEGVKILQEEYLNAINQVLDTMDKNVWGMSLDDLKDDWDHIQNLADEYLDDVEGAYKIQTLANKIDKSIAETSSLKAQQKLQKLREDEIAMLREKENLTQDDIDLAEARYQIALKEIALEEAQTQKTSMKLTRDTSGNWTYQYVADEEDILAKQQELLDAYNTLYETADEAYAHAMELAMETYETMQEKIREIAEDMTLSEEEKMQRIQEIYDTYLPEIEAAVGNSELYRQEAMAATAMVFAEVCEQDAEAYETLTDKQKELVDAVRDNHLDDYEEVRAAVVDGMYPEVRDAAVEAFKETNMNSKTAAADMIHDWAQPGNAGSVRSMIDAAIDDMQKHIQNYEKELDKLQQVAGVDFDKLGQAIDTTSTKTDNLNDATRNLCDDSAGYLDTLRGYVDEVAEAWERVIDQIQQAKAELEEFLALSSSGGGDSGGSSGGGNTGGGGGGSSGGGGGSGGGQSYSSADVEGIAGNIWVYGDWGNNPTRKATMIQKFGETNGTALYNAVQAKFNSGYGYNGGLEHDYSYYKNYGPSSFASGGYTGDWDSTGRLGILHQKELVLNADDTANMLQAVQTIRDLTQLNDSISSAIAASIGQMALSLVANGGGNISGVGSDNTENQYYITAEFPNANDVESIREAILSLPNLASQYIHQTK